METQIKKTRIYLKIFIGGLVISGLTAIPIEAELSVLTRLFPVGTVVGDWLDSVYIAFRSTNNEFPFLSYGYDWLAFAHFLFAILFIGPLKNPVQNKWVIEFGLLACVLIIPFALIAGQVRGIPFWWRLVDCSFGIIGILVLGAALANVNSIEEEAEPAQEYLF